MADWPKPLNPPPTADAHRIETDRALLTKGEESLNCKALTILYQDEHGLLAIDKPAGRYCEAILEQLIRERPDDDIIMAHRLDRDTSGVMLFTTNPTATKAV
ncbi:hypothetical protein CYMTET_22726, partial [Cymbomonas tetramitiformis]